MYLISACLAGVDCKYSGGNNEDERIISMVKEGKAILVCPEQLGGLPTPRDPSEIISSDGCQKVVTNKGEVVTAQFLKGALETLKIANIMGIKKAILKTKSPSCGHGKIYDGSFSKKLIDGSGLTAELLERNGIEIYSEDSLDRL